MNYKAMIYIIAHSDMTSEAVAYGLEERMEKLQNCSKNEQISAKH